MKKGTLAILIAIGACVVLAVVVLAVRPSAGVVGVAAVLVGLAIGWLGSEFPQGVGAVEASFGVMVAIATVRPDLAGGNLTYGELELSTMTVGFVLSAFLVADGINRIRNARTARPETVTGQTE
jgi:hypothetical protein